MEKCFSSHGNILLAFFEVITKKVTKWAMSWHQRKTIFSAHTKFYYDKQFKQTRVLISESLNIWISIFFRVQWQLFFFQNKLTQNGQKNETNWTLKKPTFCVHKKGCYNGQFKSVPFFHFRIDENQNLSFCSSFATINATFDLVNFLGRLANAFLCTLVLINVSQNPHKHSMEISRI